MKFRNIDSLLAIVLATLIILSMSSLTVLAKPVAPNPGTSWPGGTVWGTGLRLENGIYAGAAWFGAGSSEIKIAAPPDPVDGVLVEFLEGGTKYATIVRLQVAAPQSYSYPVRMRSLGIAPSNATLSSVMENADTSFVPQDFSVVLDNSTAGIFVNLREENGYITGLPKLATLYVDNHVNVTIAPGLQSGNYGDTVNFTVTVYNTGRYNDNFSLSVDAGGWTYSLGSSLLSINAGNNANTNLGVTLGAGTKVITVTADGVYADDNATCTAQALPGVDVSITPAENSGENGTSVTFDVTVTNTGAPADNFDVTVSDDAGWVLTLADNLFELGPGESGNTTLTVDIPGVATHCTRDNIIVNATGRDNTLITDNGYCVAHCVFGLNVDVEAQAPTYQDGYGCQDLTYEVLVKNVGVLDDNYLVTLSETLPWGAQVRAQGILTAQLLPTDDAQVRGAYPTNNYGALYNMYTGVDYADDENAMRSYLQFDISGLPAGATILSATLNANSNYGPSRDPSYTDENDMVTCRSVSDDGWGEMSINWSNAPAMGGVLDIEKFIGDGWAGTFKWYSWDVTSYVVSEFAGDQVVSLGLKSENEARTGLNTAAQGWFHTKDNNTPARAAYKPYLEVIYASWTPWGDNVQVEVPTGENRVVEVKVHVPDGSVYCDTDVITVTATSISSPTVSDSDDVTAHSLGTIDVAVDVEPEWDEAQSCETIYYKAVVSNTGNVDDWFDVDVSDTLGWDVGLQIDSLSMLAEDDSYVGNVDENNNYGSASTMYIGNIYWSPYENQRALLKFDLSGVPGTIITAILNGYDYNGTYSQEILIDAMGVDNDDWDESTITWANAPWGDVGPVLDSDLCTFAGGWNTWNVTSFVAGEHTSDGVASILLQSENEGDTPYDSAGYSSKESTYTWQRIYLEVVYTDPSLDRVDSVEVFIPVGENVELDVCVHIPKWAQAFDNDDITVTATSTSNPDRSDSDTVIAHNKAPASVVVDVTPDILEAHASIVDELINPSVRYDPVTFTVAITNTGIIDDLYKLEVVDSADPDWGIKVDPAEIFVPAGDTEYAILSVTVPEDTEGGVTNEVTVIVEGKMASKEQEIIRPTDNDTVSVITQIIEGVEMEVLPECEPQTGAPGSPLVWLVVIKNTGNDWAEFNLSVDEALSGVSQVSAARSSWGATLDNTFFALDPFTKAITYLRVTVPEDAKTCEWDNITVTIRKVGYENEIYDIDMVRAHAVEPGPRLPEGVIEISVEAEIIAIDVWPVKYDFGVMDEHKTATSDNFKVRNVGNVDQDIYAQGTDAKSMPGEPVTTWTLSDTSIGIDMYRLGMTPGPWLSTSQKLVWSSMSPGDEEHFALVIETPTVITTPARMYARVKLTAVRAGEAAPP